MGSLSKPSREVFSEADKLHVRDKIFWGVGEVVMRKIDKKILDCNFRLKQEVINDIRRQKTDPEGAIRKAEEAKAVLEELGPKAARDSQRLLRGELNRESAELSYRDERIFDIVVPQHLLPVLTANGVSRNICLFQKLIEITNHVDKNLAIDIATGFRTIGHSPITGLWPPRDNSMAIEKPVEDFYNTRIVVKKSVPTLEADILDHIIGEIEEDMKKGRYREITKEMLKVQPMVAFGVKQKNKIRLIIDERLKNSYSILSEKLILKGTSHLVEAIRAFHCDIGMEGKREMMPGSQRAKAAYVSIMEELENWKDEKDTTVGASVSSTPSVIAEAMRRNNASRSKSDFSGRGPAAGLRDFKKAYYQVGVLDPADNAIQAYDRALGIWRVFEAVSLTMGNTHSVTSWCRIAEAAEHFSRVLGGLIQFIYIDDSTTLAVNEDVLVIQMEFLDLLNLQLGLEISDKPEARQDSINDDVMLILGLEYSFKEVETSITVPEKKKEKIVGLCNKLISDLNAAPKDRAVKHNDIQSLVGNLVYALYSSGERSGNAVLHGLYPWFDEGFFNRNIKNRLKKRMLKRTLHFVIKITETIKPIVMRRDNAIREQVHLFTDASSDGGQHGGAGLGAALLMEDGSWIATAREAKTERIDILELKAVLMAFETFHEKLREKDIVVHVDNAGDIYALVRGVHKTQRGSAIIHKVYEAIVSAECSVFFDYIKSEANIADFFTRWGKFDRGLKWTQARMMQPVLTELDIIEEETASVKLGETAEEGHVPGWWMETNEEMASWEEDETEDDREVDNEVEDDEDWICWAPQMARIANSLFSKDDVGEEVVWDGFEAKRRRR